MKNILSKWFIVLFYFYGTLVTLAQPGTEDENDSLESIDNAPIDSYIWVLLIAAVLFVYFKHRKALANHN